MKLIAKNMKTPVLLMILLFGLLAACANAIDAIRLVPYDLAKFRAVLDRSKLQYPNSNTDVPYGEFEAVQTDYFYLSDGGFMTFETIKGRHDDVKRVELRQGPDVWKTSTGSLKRMHAELKLFYPETIREYSWMQIHDSGANEPFINKPLIRLLWRKERKGKDDHLWAVIRTSNRPNGGPSPLWVDMGKRPNSFFEAEIRVYNNLLSVTIDNREILRKDVSYWQEFSNYFKTGIYLSGSVNDGIGPNQKLVKVQFKTLLYQLD